MIKSVVIKNFQSHKDTVLEFHPGVNVIKGSSSNGKSSILRALNYVINNKPIGMKHISYWAKSKKTILDECRVTINFDDCTVARMRGDINGYQINDDKPLEAIETGVPTQVTDACRISEINIQKQLDAPFLLSSSSGQVSQFFNRIMKLEDADEYQSAVEGKRRKCNTDIKQVEESIPVIENSLNEFVWIGKADILIKEIVAMEKEYIALSSSIERLLTSIKDIKDFTLRYSDSCVYKDAEIGVNSIDEMGIKWSETLDNVRALATCKDRIAKYSSEICDENIITDASNLLEGIRTKLTAIEEAERGVTRIRAMITKLQTSTSMLCDASIVDNEYINSIDKILEKYNTVEGELDRIKHLKGIIQVNDMTLNSTVKELKEAEAEMPKVCPLCGKEIANG